MLFRETAGFLRLSLYRNIKKGIDNMKITIMLLGNKNQKMREIIEEGTIYSLIKKDDKRKEGV
ncbi:MAG: hypothetical protein AMS17_05405 [Spirochaetes bacterium DG_61]|jgi:hypothetical protein|nr:MAG: hypothetical protein AMS17_05405 [Spirochaetes bacterium DG_61]